ncbi:hypothetical protein CEE69_22915 [Rhodopirellula bahusiensis]|uniref:Uncharacterized protein n=1 Tax=Rhodopirellula bahusiensis TaxID=2014065 RepID=A0A2G1W326_9BACT|nr:hypothetical protein CEE69_22915 [Rhodopirellula bahusiensis]
MYDRPDGETTKLEPMLKSEIQPAFSADDLRPTKATQTRRGCSMPLECRRPINQFFAMTVPISGSMDYATDRRSKW